MGIKDLLIKHEGLRLKPYRCTAGKLTIGVGRNLEDVGISEDEALYLLECDIKRVRADADAIFPWFCKLSDSRKDVIISMIFNIGLHGFLEFKKTISAIAAGNFEQAAKEMLESKWAAQVGKRGYELSEMMRTGQYINEGGK